MTSPVGQTGLAEYSLALRAGTMLADQYTIVGVLGRPGGFGITYLAEDIRLESLVAIKEFLPRELATRAPDSTAVVTHDSDGGFRHGLEQFLREARTLAKIHHPSVVRVRQFFEANGTAYLVMEYLEGQTLSDLLKQEGGRLPAAQAVEIIIRVLDGLRAAHTLNIYHRDVKPSNVYITSTGLPVLLDFGAARQATGQSSSKMTAVLTPGFAPLEQYGHRGQGPWTDIYAAAAVLYHVITGVDPVPATDRVGEEADPMLPPADIDPDIGQPLSDAIMKGLSMVPRSRPQSADEFQRLLTAAIAQTRPAEKKPDAVASPDASQLAAHDATRARPTPGPGVLPFVPALADTLGPADLISPEPLRPAASGSTPVLPIVPSLADTLGPADLPHPELPATAPSARGASPPSVPSLADTIAAWRVTPPKPRPTTPPAPAPAAGAAADRGEAVSGAINAAPIEPAVESPSEPSVSIPSREKPSGLFVSDAFKAPADIEVALHPVADSDAAGEVESDRHMSVDREKVDSASSPAIELVEQGDPAAPFVVDDSVAVRASVPVPNEAAEELGGTPAGSGPASLARQLWARATDTRQKQVGLAAAALVVLVGSGLLLATPRGTEPVATPIVDSTTKVSTGETTPAIDSVALRDSLARIAEDSIKRADSLRVAAAARAKDSIARATAPQRVSSKPSRGTGRGEGAAIGGAQGAGYQDTGRQTETPASQQGSATALLAAAEEHLRTIVDDFMNVLRSRDEAGITAALDESDRSAEARATLLKFLHDRRPNVESVTPAEVSLSGDVAQQYFTVKFTWREGRIRHSNHADYAVFRATARHTGGKWSAEKPDITRPPESK